MDTLVKVPECPRISIKCRKDMNCRKSAMMKCSIIKLENRVAQFEKNMTDYMPREEITEKIAEKMKERNERTGCEILMEIGHDLYF